GWRPSPRQGKPPGSKSSYKGTYIYLTPRRLVRVRSYDMSDGRPCLALLGQPLGVALFV
ncbi:hypothetical protein glysoja_013234, partial [Glycine soja]